MLQLVNEDCGVARIGAENVADCQEGIMRHSVVVFFQKKLCAADQLRVEVDKARRAMEREKRFLEDLITV